MDLFKGFASGMRFFGETIGVLINSVLLFFAYIFGIGLSSLLAGITGNRRIATTFEKNSYWKDLQKTDPAQWYKQY